MRGKGLRYLLLKFSLVFVLCLMFALGGLAQNVSLPPVNLGLTAFLDGVAGPGAFAEQYFEYYDGFQFNNKNGNKIPGKNSLKSFSTITHIAYITKLKLLGGYYGFEMLLPIANIDLDMEGGPKDKKTGFGDVCISPFLLQWTDSKLFGRPFFHRFALGINVPTGKYNKNNDINPGSNLYSFNSYYAFTMFITPKLTTSWRLSYLWNSKNNNPNKMFNANNIQPGQAFHVNYALSYEFLNKLRVGLAGYYLKQFTPDTVGGNAVTGSMESSFALGPGILFKLNKIDVHINSYFEIATRNRPEGNKIVIHLSKVFL